MEVLGVVYVVVDGQGDVRRRGYVSRAAAERVSDWLRERGGGWRVQEIQIGLPEPEPDESLAEIITRVWDNWETACGAV